MSPVCHCSDADGNCVLVFLNHRLPLLCWCFGEVSNELISPIYSTIAAVAVKEEGAVVIPGSTNRCVPVSGFVHLFKRVLEQVTSQPLSLKLIFDTEPDGMEPVLCVRMA